MPTDIRKVRNYCKYNVIDTKTNKILFTYDNIQSARNKKRELDKLEMAPFKK
jgi:hypothetical protein